MKLELEIHTTVKKCIFQGEVAFPEERKIEMSILEMAKESKVISVKEIIQELKFHNAIAERLFRNLVDLNYLDLEENNDNYYLTEKGESAIVNNRLYIPQTGLWEIYWIEDDRITNNTGFKVLEINAFVEKKDGKGTNHIISTLPQSITHLLNIEQSIGRIGKYQYCELRNVESKCQDLSELNARLLLIYDSEKGNSSGELKYVEKSIPFRSKNTFEDVWKELQNVYHPFFIKYEQDKARYLISYDEIKASKNALEQFTYDFHYTNPSMFQSSSELLGDIQKTSFFAYSIFPETDQDAQIWFYTLLIDSLREYTWNEIYEKKNQELLGKFPDRKVAPYLLQTVANDFWKDRNKSDEMKAKAWYLNAPIDLDYAKFTKEGKNK